MRILPIENQVRRGDGLAKGIRVKYSTLSQALQASRVSRPVGPGEFLTTHAVLRRCITGPGIGPARLILSGHKPARIGTLRRHTASGGVDRAWKAPGPAIEMIPPQLRGRAIFRFVIFRAGQMEFAEHGAGIASRL